MRLSEMRLYGTTDSDGAMTVNGKAVLGQLYAVQWIDGTLSDGVGAVISTQNHEAAVASLMTLTAANNDALYYPRHRVHDSTGAALDDSSINDSYTMPLMAGTPRLVVSAGGASHAGGCILFYFEE